MKSQRGHPQLSEMTAAVKALQGYGRLAGNVQNGGDETSSGEATN